MRHQFKLKTLSYNSNDVQVKHAQEMLKSLGYVPGREDGYFSKETESALKAFQNANEMEATGQLDKKTAEAIQTKIIEKFVLEKMIYNYSQH